MTIFITILVPGKRIELLQCYHYQILSLARLPVPPSRPKESMKSNKGWILHESVPRGNIDGIIAVLMR